MEAQRLELGTVLAGKYRLGPRLGEGGMGTVYRAEHLVLKAPVAVKVIDRELVEGDLTLARFMREAQAAASLRSPHVVQILDYGMEGARPFMVMELLEGETLASRIERMGRLSPADTYWVILHVARAVSKAHEASIIHRDLKPDNVFLVHNEGDEIAKVLDFGVAKMDSTGLSTGTQTRTGSLLGTPYYMSPEQAQGNKEVDHRSDLWALGVIAFECLTGVRPFSSDGLGDLVIQICIRDIVRPSSVAEVPPGFDAWFEKAVARDPEARFQTARELAESLRGALGLGAGEAKTRDAKWSLPASLPGTSGRPDEPASMEAPPPPFLLDRGGAPATASDPDAVKTRVEVSVSPGALASLRPNPAPPKEPLWQVLPHSEDEQRVERSSHEGAGISLRGVMLVSISAIFLGAGIVFALQEAKVLDLGLGRSKPLPGAERRAKPSASKSKKPEAAPAKVSPQPPPPRSAPPPTAAGTARPSGGSSALPADELVPPTEAEVLDAVDEAAGRWLSTGGGDPGAPAPASGGRPEPRPGEEAAGPRPEVPEHLQPAPAPPEPVPAPTP